MKNVQLAEIFYEMADILEMKGIQWKPQAYRKAARSVESLAEDVAVIAKKGKLEDIPGVGHNIAAKIEEFLKTGKIKAYKKLRKSIPKGVEEMMHIQGLGPKTAWKLYKKLKITSVAKLKKAAKGGKISKLAGFGVKSEQDILAGLGMLAKGKERSLVGNVLPLALELEQTLQKQRFIKKAVLAGSLRRRKETIKDIDILAISTQPKKAMDFFTTLPDVRRVLAKGPTKSSVVLKQGINSDLRVLNEKSFGAALNYFTGSKDHNIALRQIAIKKGYKLSEYGLFKGKKFIAGRTEQELYKKLGLRYIEPELRERTGEIEAARKNKLPKLVMLQDIKGDLHMHTTWTDGAHSMDAMIKKGIEMKYKYIAITDHSKSTYIAKGLDAKKLRRHNKEVEKLNKKYREIRVFKGSEVDILKDGRMDYPDAVLKELDVVIASVHASFKMSPKDMTKRLLKAIDNRYVSILGHPTARLINKREGYTFNIDKVFQAAKDNDVALEINSFPLRLDLRDVHVRKAMEIGNKLVINTDSHATDHLHLMMYGVATARRGWAEKKNIINTWNLSRLEKFIKR